MGWYANNCGCSEAAQFGSVGGHVRQDAQAAAELLFDSIKVDGCGPSQNITVWTAELNATGRPILLEDCLTKRYTRRNEPAPVPLAEVFDECPGNFFRLGPDIAPQFYSTMYNLIYTYNMMSTYNSAAHPASRPGCWTYSDMLEVGNGLSVVESRTHFAAFAITSSPLVLGFDLTNGSLYDELYPIVANQRVLAINQQWSGSAGTLVTNSTEYFEAPTAHGASGKVLPGNKSDVRYPTWQVWHKPLAIPQGSQAVLVINLSEEPQDVRVAYADLGLHPAKGGAVKALDAWTGASVTAGVGATGLDFAAIAGHDNVFLVVTPAAAL